MSCELVTILPSIPHTTRGSPLVLGPDPKCKNILYAVGNTIVIRSLENTQECDIYAQHVKETTVAKFSPSGFYIASADQTGKVRIWDTVNKEHILKCEYQSLSGAIKDMSWSEDSKRLCVAGYGREVFGSVFLIDTGSSVGGINGHTKQINSVDYKPNRPYRIVTASEDYTIKFFEGPPFKFKTSIDQHTNFVNAVRYSPDGSKFVSGGADGKAAIGDGKTGEFIGLLGNPKAHNGGIYSVCFSPDSKQILTVSGDKTAKIFDAEEMKEVIKFEMGKNIADQQLGCLWTGDNIITISLSGVINFLDPENPSTPKKVLKGHNKAIYSLALSADRKTTYTASYDGLICYWDNLTGNCDVMQGKGHTNQVQAMAVDGDTLVSVGMDDTVRFSSHGSHEYGLDIKLNSQPRGCDSVGGIAVVSCLNEIVVFRDGKMVSDLKICYEPSHVSIHPTLNEVAVGGMGDQIIHIYAIDNDRLVEKKTMSQTGSITCVKFSPDGERLVASDTNRRVVLYSLPNYDVITDGWIKHTAKILHLAWSPDSKFVASCGVDTHLVIYNAVDYKKNLIFFHGAHPLNTIFAVGWTDNNTLLSAGQDCCIRKWKVTE